MFIEAAIICVIIFFVLEYNGTISINKFVNDNKSIFKGLKEEDFLEVRENSKLSRTLVKEMPNLLIKDKITYL